jgi:hypothetical protein
MFLFFSVHKQQQSRWQTARQVIVPGPDLYGIFTPMGIWRVDVGGRKIPLHMLAELTQSFRTFAHKNLIRKWVVPTGACGGHELPGKRREA